MRISDWSSDVCSSDLHQRHHRLDHGHAADADAWIVAALGGDFGRRTVAIDCLYRGQDRTGRFARDAQPPRLHGRTAAHEPAGLIGEAIGAVGARAHRTGLALSAQRGGGAPHPDRHALYGDRTSVWYGKSGSVWVNI